jgi:hypothetical protein
MRQDSIRDYNLHSSYPLHLNQQGLYQGHPPNICQCMPAKLPTVSETMEGIHCNLDKREEEQEIRE